MFGSLGAPELLIIGLIILLLFGVGKLSGLGRDLGSSVKEFRKAVKDEDDQGKAQPAPVQQPPQQYIPPQQTYAQPPPQQYAPPPPQYAPPAPAPVAQQPAPQDDQPSRNIF